MGQMTTCIASGGKRARAYAERMLKDVPAERFARKPLVRTPEGERTIETNHPAFIYGHLALYPARILAWLGEDVAPAAVPDAWEPLFAANAPCRDDPTGTIYPPMEQITSAFFRGYDALLAALPGVDDAKLAAPTPDERYREYFPTLGEALVVLVANHVSMHMGQVSVWRRCFGLGPA